MQLFLPPLASTTHAIFGTLMFLTALFLILLVLIQRGRGGGLAGAFGGMGGQSAFGTKAGDLFTRVTIGVAAFWILLCVIAISVMNSQTSVFGTPAAGGPSALENVGPAQPPADSALPPFPGGPAETTPAETSDSAPSDSTQSAGPAATTSDDAATEDPAP